MSLNRSEHCAPNLLITFINMMLFKEDTPDPNLVAICKGNETYMFPGQKQLQMVLVSVRPNSGLPLAVWLSALCNLLPWS